MRMKIYFLVPVVCFLLLVSYLFGSNKVYFVDSSASSRDLTKGRSKVLNDILSDLGYEFECVKNTKYVEDYSRIIHNKMCSGDFIRAKRSEKDKLILFLWEPPVVSPEEYEKRFHEPFSKVFTFCDDLVDNEKYFKFNNPIKVCSIEESDLSFQEKKLAVMINADKDSTHHLSLYGERRKVIRFYEQYHLDDFDLYGNGWKKRGYRNYKGAVTDKISCLKNYRFCFAYENTRNLDGYITEKIFDAMFAGTVPIYLGAGNVTDYIPKNCFIDRRDFESDEELYRFIKNMSEDEHSIYIENIRQFLQSDQCKAFSWESWLETVLQFVEPNCSLPQSIS